MPVRDAATVIIVRDAARAPKVLMGQRGKGAIFMPNKFVFPGGAVDAEDGRVALGAPLDPVCRRRLTLHATDASPEALAVAAIREVWEETGHRFAVTDTDGQGGAWSGFGGAPSASALRFFFRAVTPPGRPRRFDARFFLAPAEALADDPDALPQASDELSHLTWVPLSEVRALDTAFVTELVLAELSRHLPSLDAPERVPFVRADSLSSDVIWL